MARAILNAGHSVFLTGPAGSGKTYVLNAFIKEARSSGKSVAVTASTGIAATHLGGNTIHAWSGIGIHDKIHDRMISDMSKARRDQISKADVLIIDEVSMLHDFRLDLVEEVCRLVRENNEPFGGLQVVLSGDFFQLPPVNREDSMQGGFITNAHAWEQLDPIVCYLEEQHRQDNDMLLEILTALRTNDLRRRHAEALLARKTARTPFDDPVTELYTRNVDVDAVNQSKLDNMKGELHEYEMEHSGRKSGEDSLMKSCLAPEVLQLKKGALVMFVKNSPERRYVNGTLGTVVGFDKTSDYPIVATHTGGTVAVEPDTWELRDGEKKIASIAQLPLRLAWAITIHKSQGMTLDGAHIDLSTAFVPGMGYVALSRVKNLESLTLGGLNKMALTMHEEAHEIDIRLRKKSSRDVEQFADLEAQYLKEQKKRDKLKPSATGNGAATWKAKLDKMRSEYPNAYKPWKTIEDETLVNQFKAGVDVAKLSALLGRHRGSVRARLKKHFGDDVKVA